MQKMQSELHLLLCWTICLFK